MIIVLTLSVATVLWLQFVWEMTCGTRFERFAEWMATR